MSVSKYNKKVFRPWDTEVKGKFFTAGTATVSGISSDVKTGVYRIAAGTNKVVMSGTKFTEFSAGPFVSLNDPTAHLYNVQVYDLDPTGTNVDPRFQGANFTVRVVSAITTATGTDTSGVGVNWMVSGSQVKI